MTSTVASPPPLVGPTSSPGARLLEEALEDIQNSIRNIPSLERSSSDSLQARYKLKQELTRLAKALTRHEHGFLEQLADHGDENAVAKARERLADASLFFELSHHNLNHHNLNNITNTTNNTNNANSETSTNNHVNSNSNHHEATSTVSAPTANMLLDTSIPTTVDAQMRRSSIGSDGNISLLGTDRRLEYLENRRKSMHGQMWKAHECGMTLGRMVARHSAMASLQPPIIAAKAGILRSTSVLSASPQERAMEEAKIFRPQEMTVPAIPRPDGKMSRGFSDGSRKSVTFNDIKQFRLYNRRASVDLPLTSNKGPRMARSSSITLGIALDEMFGASSSSSVLDSSVNNNNSSNLFNMSSNSLLDSSTNTLESFPPIKQAHRLDSFGSTPSIHLASSIHSDGGSTTNNSLISSGMDTSIPSLHPGQPVQSDSLAEPTLSWDMSEEDSVGGVKEVFRKKFSQGWASPLAAAVNDVPAMKPQLLRPPAADEAGQSPPKPVLLRRASQNFDDGEGIEVTEWEGDSLNTSFRVDTLTNARMYSSMMSLDDSTTGGTTIKTASSYDEGPTYNQDNKEDIFRIRKSFSDDEVANIFLGVSRRLLKDKSITELQPEDDFDEGSWLGSDIGGGHFDSWNVLKDDYENGYGGGDTLPFRILGTSSDDVDSHPHVLSPPLMESLQNFLPWSLSESNFWMKYSMVRDGASLHSLLQHIRGSKYTILAVETMDGEVFGSFTANPWRKNWNFFGSGESFLWRMRHSRQEKCNSIIDQAHMESEIDVYPWTQENTCFQLCTHNRIAVGGGSTEAEEGEVSEVKAHEWGFGLVLDSDLLSGTTSPCATFGNPSLSTVHGNGSRFEVINLEVWTLTPCATLEEALKLELGQLFLEAN